MFGYCVIIVDLFGFGKSKFVFGQIVSIENYVQIMVGFMDVMKFDKVVVGGMSMGGMILFQMYKIVFECFKGLILIDIIVEFVGIVEVVMWCGIVQQVQ